jgi:hypothetical protein
MKKGLVVGLILGVVLAATAAATAGRPNPKVVRLTKEVHVLEHHLHNMTTARNALKASLDQANAQNAGLESQAAGLEAKLQQRTNERDAALARASSLQAQLAAIPTPSAVAFQQVHREVNWAQAAAGPQSAGALTSLSAMNYVVGHVSAGAYGYLELNGLPLPNSNLDVILGVQAGICGHAAIVFAKIMENFGYPVQSVQFYWTLPDGTAEDHIAVEVYFDAGWHYFDPTYGLYWTNSSGNVLSITDERTNGGTEHKDDISFTNLIESTWFGGDDTAFETDPGTTVVVGAQTLAAAANRANAPLPLWGIPGPR